MNAVWTSQTAGKGPREPSGWLSTVGAAAPQGEMLSWRGPQGELTGGKVQDGESAPRVNVGWHWGWGSCALDLGSYHSGSFCPRPAPWILGIVS